MSQEYKDKIDKLCTDADNGNTKATKELLDQAAYWSAKNKELIKERDKKDKKDDK